jgi:glycine cleavage system H protein
MEGFTYHNIFETKGIEYLLIIGFFVILIPFWIILSKHVKTARLLKGSMGFLSARSLSVPQGLFFSKFHTWTHLERSGVARVGLDDFLLHLTGPVKFKPVKQPGDNINKGELLATIMRDGKQLDIFSPISGEIVEENRALQEDSDQLNFDPCMKGWIFKIKPASWITETKSYYLAEKATAWSTRELDRFKGWLATSSAKYDTFNSGIVLQDGGELVEKPLAELPVELWQDFQESFLSGRG